MSNFLTEGPYTLNMEYPRSAEKQASAPVGAGPNQRKQSGMQQAKKLSGKPKQAAAKAGGKAPSGKTTDCSSALQQLEATSSNFASTLRGNYISLLDKKY